jgi:ABC-type glycerol-3-phosphate transport system permease component
MAKKKIVRLRRQDQLYVQIPVFCVIVIAIGFALLPTIITCINSFKSQSEINLSIMSLPEGFRWQNYVEAFEAVKASILSSLIIAVVGALGQVVIAAVVAYVFSYCNFYGKNVIFYLYISVMFIPSALNLPALYALAYKLDLINSVWGIWLPGWAAGQVGSMFLLRVFFQNQPRTIIEAAQIDGASDFDLALRVVIPMAIPIFIYLFLGAVGSRYDDYLWPSLILRGENLKMIATVMMEKSATLSESNMGAAYAMYIVAGIPMIVVSGISLRFFTGVEFSSALKM